MNRAFIVLAMKRSGHHAIIYWIAKNLGESVELRNDCILQQKRERLVPNPRQPEGSKIIQLGKNPKHTIFNIEDFNPKSVKEIDLAKLSQMKYYDTVNVLLVMRDPYNWVASSIKTGGGPLKRLENRIKIYKMQYEFIITNPGKIWGISFNEWFENIKYRSELASALKLKFCDKGVDEVPPRGGGSSFDQLKKKYKAQEMKVLNRWEHYRNVPSFWNYFDEEMKDIGKDFGMIFDVLKYSLF